MVNHMPVRHWEKQLQLNHKLNHAHYRHIKIIYYLCLWLDTKLGLKPQLKGSCGTLCPILPETKPYMRKLLTDPKMRNMRQFAVIFLTVLTIFLIACGQNIQKENQVEIPENWKVLNEAFFFIHYPDTFELDKSGQMGTNFILLSNQTSEHDLFQENINLIIQDLKGYNISLDQYVEISEGQINTMIVDGKIIESERVKGENDRELHRIIYTGKQEPLDLKWLQYYWVVNEKAYVLTLTTETTQFDNYLAVGEKIMNTFKIK